MSGSVLLDTNIVIALPANDRSVLGHLEEDVAVFLSTIVLGELLFGAHASTRVDENISRIAEFAGSNTVLVCDGDTARHYGQIKAQLRRVGKPIPENDIWIAATARQHALTVVSRAAHFDSVEGLGTVAW